MLFLVDGNSLTHRARFAIGMKDPDAVAPDVVAQNVEKSVGIWADRLRAQDYEVGVIFDGHGAGAWRKRLDPEYKANRESHGAVCAEQFAATKLALGVRGWRVLAVEGEEADDVIATLATNRVRAGGLVTTLSGDRDLLQLASAQITVALVKTSTRDAILWTGDALEAEWRFPPARLADLRALTGERGDNIVGVPGIGDKIGNRLICRFGDIDGIYEAQRRGVEITGPLSKRLEECEARVRVNLDLVRLRRDVPIY